MTITLIVCIIYFVHYRLKEINVNLTFKQLDSATEALRKVLNCTILENYQDAIAISTLKKPFEEAFELSEASSNAIVLKYFRKQNVPDRISAQYPKGYLDADEQEENIKERTARSEMPCTVDFKFPRLSEATVELLFNGFKGKDQEHQNMSSYELAVLSELGMLPKEAKKEKK